jgi:hypothetical protein
MLTAIKGISAVYSQNLLKPIKRLSDESAELFRLLLKQLVFIKEVTARL